MGRINIDDDIESRDQFWRLMSLVNDRDACLGKLVRFFRLAQKRFGRSEPLSEKDLSESGLTCMIESGWAIPCEGGFQALGADKQFAWLAQRAAAGRKRWEDIRQAEAQTRNAESCDRIATEVRSDTDAKPPSLAPAPALSPAHTKKQEGESDSKSPPESVSVTVATAPAPGEGLVRAVPKPGRGKKLTPEEGSAVQKLIAAYVEGFQSRYGPEARPDVGKVSRGVLVRLLNDFGFEKARNLIQVYCQISDRWFDEKHHDLVTLEKNVNKVMVAMARGDGSGLDWNRVDWDGGGHGARALPGAG